MSKLTIQIKNKQILTIYSGLYNITNLMFMKIGASTFIVTKRLRKYE